MFNEVSSIFVDLMFLDSFELVTNDNFSDKEDGLDVERLPEFL